MKTRPAHRYRHVQVEWPRWASNLARRIGKRRRQCSYDQKTLAELMGVDPSVISRWEAGKQIPTLEGLFRLAKVLELNLTSLIPVTWRRKGPKIWRRRKRAIERDQSAGDERPAPHEADAAVAKTLHRAYRSGDE